METYLVLALLGLGAGALYSTLAQGLVITYRASGVVNFAQGAMAMYIAYTYSELRAKGQLLIPPIPNPLALIEFVTNVVGRQDLDLPDIPTFVKLSDGGMTTPWAFVVCILLSVVLGVAVHLLVFRPLRSSPPVAKVVASVGLMLTLSAIVTLRFGSDQRAVPKILPTSTVEVFGTQVPVDRFWLAGIALLLAVVTWAAFRFTRLGWATEAAAESEKGAILSGLSPDRLALISWVVSALVAGVIGILFSTLTTLSPVNYTLFILPAMAAALVARFNSIPVAALVGLGIGMIEGMMPQLAADVSWLPPVGLAKALPLIIVMVVLFVRSRPIPTRGELIGTPLPASPEPRSALSLLVPLAVLGTIGSIWLPYAYRGALINSLIGVMIALSLVIITGFVGQVSLMQMALAGAAALAMTRIAGDWHVPFPLSIVLAATAAAIVGVLFAGPALRIRGVQLAIVTIMIAVTFDAMVLRNPDIVSDSDAVGSVPPPELFGVKFGVNDSFFITRDGLPNPGFALACLLCVLVFAAFVMNWRRNSTGRLFLAIRSNERAAAAMGLNVATIKIGAFALSAFIAGIAGGLSAYRFEGLSPDSFGVLVSITAFAVAYLGGITSVGGAMFAGILVLGGIGPRITADIFDEPRLDGLIAGVGLILTIIFNPQGMASVMSHTVHKVADARRRLRGPSTNASAVRALPGTTPTSKQVSP